MQDLSTMRQDYFQGQLRRADLIENPFFQFEAWLNDARRKSVPEANAFSLATVGIDQRPSQRTVLLKKIETDGFVFFSNYGSQKAMEIENNPWVAAHFVWLTLQRQVRIEGRIEKISEEESEAYFHSRPRGSQLGAWASFQSKEVASRSILETRFAKLNEQYQEGEIPMPSNWGGYRIVPDRFEFWQGGHDRLHDRFVYQPGLEDWSISRLEP